MVTISLTGWLEVNFIGFLFSRAKLVVLVGFTTSVCKSNAILVSILKKDDSVIITESYLSCSIHARNTYV